MSRKSLLVFSAVAFLCCLLTPADAASLPGEQPERHFEAIDRVAPGHFRAEDVARFLEAAQRFGAATAAVVLDVDWVPEGYLSTEELVGQRSRITAAQNEVIAAFPISQAALDVVLYFATRPACGGCASH